MLRELREERDETKSIVEITKCVYEGRVAFFDNRCQRVLWRFLEVVFSQLGFTTAEQFLVLL